MERLGGGDAEPQGRGPRDRRVAVVTLRHNLAPRLFRFHAFLGNTRPGRIPAKVRIFRRSHAQGAARRARRVLQGLQVRVDRAVPSSSSRQKPTYRRPPSSRRGKKVARTPSCRTCS
jgi:hypothetical protein